jgi:hypothetical protein
VFSGFSVPWFLAASPIRRSPSGVNATTDGVMRLPWSLAMISTRPSLKMPTTEKVVPRSMPTTGPSTLGSDERGQHIARNERKERKKSIFFANMTSRKKGKLTGVFAAERDGRQRGQRGHKQQSHCCSSRRRRTARCRKERKREKREKREKRKEKTERARGKAQWSVLIREQTPSRPRNESMQLDRSKVRHTFSFLFR